MTPGENVVPCPAPVCDATIDAVTVICEYGSCPECDAPVSRHHYTAAEASRDDPPTTLFEAADGGREEPTTDYGPPAPVDPTEVAE
jgi:hypothetical protein